MKHESQSKFDFEIGQKVLVYGIPYTVIGYKCVLIVNTPVYKYYVRCDRSGRRIWGLKNMIRPIIPDDWVVCPY